MTKKMDLSHIDLVEFFDEQGVEYRVTAGKNGNEINVKECPICGGNQWKVYFNAETKLGVCFHGSHPTDKQFNAFRMIQSVTGLAGETLENFINDLGFRWQPAVDLKAKIAATSLYQKEKKEIEKSAHLEPILPSSLPQPLENGRLLQYLIDRRVDAKLCQFFELSVCPDGAAHVYWHEKKEFFARQDFSKRILIPIRDLYGRLMTFQGRDITGEAEKKYLFPSGLAASGRYVYNAHNAVGKPAIVITEGVFDTFAVKRALRRDIAMDHAIEPTCTFGMMLSGGTHGGQYQDNQINALMVLKRHGLKEVYIMWDNEKKALLRAVRAAEQIQKLGLRVKICWLNHKDAGDSSDQEILLSIANAEVFSLATVLKIKQRKS